MGAKLFSIEVSLFLGTLLFEGQASMDWGLTVILGVLSSFHPWQPLKEDTTSSISSSSLGGTLAAFVACRLEVEGEDFFLCCLGAYKLNGR